MKLKIIFVRKKHIYYLALGFLLILLSIVFIFSKNSTAMTFSVMDQNELIQTDLTGDGDKDILYIKSENSNYYVQINAKDDNSVDKSIQLKPDKSLNTLGDFNNYWPMRITIMDINRDKIPEIFMQSSKDKKPIYHIFTWTGEDFKDIMFGNNNILGIFDTKSNRTPTILLGNYANGIITFKSYMMVNNEPKKINYNYSSNFVGQLSISNFIRYIEGLPNTKFKDYIHIFHSKISKNNISKIDKLISNEYKYKFQDAIFKDISLDKNGEVNSLKWTLNFKAILKDKKTKNVSLDIILKPDVDKPNKNMTFKIFSINIKE